MYTAHPSCGPMAAGEGWRSTGDGTANSETRRAASGGGGGEARATTHESGTGDDEQTVSGATVLGKRARRGRKRRADVDEGNEAASRRGSRRVKTRIVTARQLERMRGGLGEPFGDGYM